MEYVLLKNESVAEGVRRIACEQIDAAIAELTDPTLDRHKATHQVRKRCKKLRGLLRLVRPRLGATYTAENVRFRDAARSLSHLRDATALIETYDKLMIDVGRSMDRRAFGPIRRALTLRRHRIARLHLDDDARLAAFLDAMHEARDRVPSWSVDAAEFAAVAGGLRNTYRRGRRAMTRAYEDPTPEAFHEWRKRVKYHWYHTLLLHNVWAPLMHQRAHVLKKLGELLGDEHDVAVLRETLHHEPDLFGAIRSLPVFTDLLDRRGAALQAAARPLGLRLYTEPPRAFTRRLGGYWDAWRGTPIAVDQQADEPALRDAGTGLTAAARRTGTA